MVVIYVRKSYSEEDTVFMVSESYPIRTTIQLEAKDHIVNEAGDRIVVSEKGLYVVEIWENEIHLRKEPKSPIIIKEEPSLYQKCIKLLGL